MSAERLLACPDCDNRVTVLQPHTRAWCQRHGRGVVPEMIEVFPRARRILGLSHPLAQQDRP